MLRSFFFLTFLTSSIACLGCGGGDDTATTTSPSGGSGGTGGASSSTGGAGGAGGSGGSTPLCATQHVETAGGKQLIVCDEAFDTAPFVHLPERKGSVDYMALAHCATFIDRAGKEHAPAKAIQGKVCNDAGADTDSRLHAFDLYEATLDASGEVTAFERYAVIDEKNILRPLDGAVAEGTISKRKNDGMFDLDPSIPIRVTLGHPKVMTSAKDGSSVYEIDATVDNLASPVLASDGSCMGALADDSGDPFPGASQAVLVFFRVPSMHLAGDDEGVFDIQADGTSLGTVMAPSWYFGPESLFSEPGKPAAYEGTGHGTPGYIPNVHFEIKKGGGGACTP